MWVLSFWVSLSTLSASLLSFVSLNYKNENPFLLGNSRRTMKTSEDLHFLTLQTLVSEEVIHILDIISETLKIGITSPEVAYMASGKRKQLFDCLLFSDVVNVGVENEKHIFYICVLCDGENVKK